MRFSVNVHMLFTEVPLLERFGRAASAGFGAAESWWPEGTDLEAYRAAILDSGLELVLLNFDGGTSAAGDRGLLSDPERDQVFVDNVPTALELAASFGCRKLNALVGLERAGLRGEQLRLAVRNVRWAADLAARQGAEVLIEPINRFDNGPYLLHSLVDAMHFIRDVDRSNVRLQFDAYHVHRTEGNVVAQLTRHAHLISHVQVADCPGRGFPGTGEIDFAGLFEALAHLGYDGCLGLEYRPRGSTESALTWLGPSLRTGAFSARQLVEEWSTGESIGKLSRMIVDHQEGVT